MSTMDTVTTPSSTPKVPATSKKQPQLRSWPERNKMILKYIPRIHKLARAMARRLPPHVPLDDLISAGALGLLDAAGRYDPNVCERFEAYAEHRIRGAMLDELRSHDSLSRDLRARSRRREEAIARLERRLGHAPAAEDIAAELGLEIEDYEHLLGRVHRGTVLSAEALTRDNSGAQSFEDPSVPDPFRVTAAVEVRDLLARALCFLPDRLQLVASMYYRDGMKLSEIGDRLGVTEARACQLRGEAVRRIREILASWDVEVAKQEEVPDVDGEFECEE